MKYIVYCTMNTVNGKIYVGVHGTENPDVFDGYIGNSINIFKANPELNHPKLPFHKAVKKYGYSAFKRSILNVFDTEQDALDLESWIVTKEFIQRQDNYNAVVGGGLPPRADRAVYLYTLSGDFVAEFPSRAVAAKKFNSTSITISNALRYKRVSFNFLWSEEKVEHLDISDFNINIQKTKVFLYDLEGNLIKEFESQGDCAKYLNTGQQNISKHIKKQTPFMEYMIFGEKGNPHKSIRKVGQYTKAGELVKIFNSVREARKEYPNVGKVLRGQANHCHGFIFKYIE